jgi:hypothetical protein
MSAKKGGKLTIFRQKIQRFPVILGNLNEMDVPPGNVCIRLPRYTSVLRGGQSGHGIHYTGFHPGQDRIQNRIVEIHRVPFH